MPIAPLPARSAVRAALLALALLGAAPAQPPIRILAAESVYGAVAKSLAGPDAEVTSVLSNPAQDPHDFEANAGTARDVAAADLVVVNGLDYDAWMDRLLDASVRPGRDVMRVSDLVGAQPGSNPHLWYAPGTMVSFAEALTAKLAAWDEADAPQFAQREKIFAAKMNVVQATIADIRKHFAGQPVTATEPVFGPMAAALGLSMRDERFQLAVMNGTEPRAGDVAAIEDDLRHRRVGLLFYNDQVRNASSDHLIAIARAARVPVVGVSETMPPGTDYPAWMLRELAAVRAALAAAT
jgi:zinc/manganese transport system substrate-binding protein